MSRYARSLDWLARATGTTPGASQTLSKRPDRFPLGAYPVAVERGAGSRVQDLDGHWYIDWICGLGAIGIGYGHPEVIAAVTKAIDRGAGVFSLPHRLEGEVAEQLCALVPGAEMARWVKTGSEACQAAVRIARLATGRELVVCFSGQYHGWHDWHAVSKPHHPGVPGGLLAFLRSADWDDVNGLQWVLSQRPVAAVICEPWPFTAATLDRAWLEALCRLAHRAGALVIFDEMVSGFRAATAGATQLLAEGGAEDGPDLVVYGKALASGYPLGAIVGPRDVMRHAWPISGTFGGDQVALAAAEATMWVYRTTPIPLQMDTAGGSLQVALANAGPEVRVGGPTWHPSLRIFPAEDEETQRLAMSVWLAKTAARGVLFHPAGWNVPGQITMDELERSTWAAVQALEEVVRIGADRAGLLAALPGEPIVQGPVEIRR